ncbi:MAG: NAD+ synthase [Planctomycetota bacterium]|nr:MAG: NAD+ synthase [Planctomycetota bacterium]
MRIALAQLNPIIADLGAIRRQLLAAAEQAHAAGAQFVVYPELAALGYPPRDLLARKRLVLDQWAMIQGLAADLPLPAVLGCVEPLYDEGLSPHLANAVVVLQDGTITASYHKRLLPVYDVFDEQRYFRPGSHPEVATIAGLRVGLTICEDIWSQDFSGVRYGQDPLGDLAGRCDVLVNCSASPFHDQKPALRRRLLAQVAHRVGAPVAYCNQVGGNDELLFDGDSCVVSASPDGDIYHGGCERWQEGVVVVDTEQRCSPPPVPPPNQDLAAALVAGIRDYCAKTGQSQVVLGLSGGLDSALVAALAVRALGPDAVTGLLMPGPYSSPGSISDAEESARLLGMRSYQIPIGAANQALLDGLTPVFHGRPANVAEENLQSRLRGTLVMATANKLGAMALTTGNKSEMAVGYCTIYGDMNGGLAPIADVYKTRCYDLAKYLNSCAPMIPEGSISKPPSAELAPDQKDEDSLPPYPVLDRILFAYIEEELGPADIIARGEDPALVARVLRLVEINEHKRRQAAPTLRVSHKAFGVGRRMPLARGVE